MRSFRWLLALLSLGVLVAANAQEKEKNGTPLTSPYFPLVVGSEWTYRAGDASFSYKVARFEDVNKVNCARIDLIMNKRVVSHEHVGITKDGVARFKFEGKEAKPPIRVLPLQLKDGMQWPVKSTLGGEALEGTFVLSKVAEKEKVQIGNKEYQAVVVTGKDLKVKGVAIGLKYYFAENVGMVKQELEVAGNKVTFELDRYELPKKKE